MEALIKTAPKLSDQYSVLEKIIRQGLFTEIKSPEAVLSLIKHHDFSVSSDDVILKAALSWVGKNSTNRFHYLHEILNHVKFSLIVKSDLEELMFPAGLLPAFSNLGKRVVKFGMGQRQLFQVNLILCQ